MEKVSKIAIFSGETSGDQYASLLAYQLKKIFADVEIIGIGGPKLQASGIRIIAEHPLSGTFGFSAVAKTLCKQVKFLHHCIRIIKKENPDLIVFIDNPGFNLTLAKNLYDFKKIYYIPPKIWAHDYQRIFLIKHFFHSVIVIFPFEKPIYEKEGIPAAVIGEVIPKNEVRYWIEPDGSRKDIIPPPVDHFWEVFFSALEQASREEGQ